MHQYIDERYHLSVSIDPRGCTIRPDELARMEERLAAVGEAIKDFPSADLDAKIIYHPQSQQYHAEFHLRLPGKSLFTGDSEPNAYAAFDRCAHKLALKAATYVYKDSPDWNARAVAQRREALDQNVVASEEDVNGGPLGKAVQAGDYQMFRTAAVNYEDWLRRRVGRWLQRYPDLEGRIGDDLTIGDLVEEVFLNAFEQFPSWSKALAFHDWLDGLIDPSLKLMLRHAAAEHENAAMVRSLRIEP